jgi:hypothetical protein
MVDRGYAIVICSDRTTASARVATKAPSGLDLPALGLLLLGLLANVSSREVYANPEYGFSILTLFGAVGCIGHLAASLSRRSGALDFANRIPVRVLTVAAVPGGYPAGEGMPISSGVMRWASENSFSVDFAATYKVSGRARIRSW